MSVGILLFPVNIIFSRTLFHFYYCLLKILSLLLKKDTGLIRGLLCIILTLNIFWSVDKYMPFKNTQDKFALPGDGRSFLRCGVVIISFIPSSEKKFCLANK